MPSRLKEAATCTCFCKAKAGALRASMCTLASTCLPSLPCVRTPPEGATHQLCALRCRQRRCCARRLRAAALPGAPAARAPCRPRPGPIPRCCGRRPAPLQAGPARGCDGRRLAAAPGRVAQRRGAQQRGGCRAGAGLAAARRRGRPAAGRGARARRALGRRGGRLRRAPRGCRSEAAGGARCTGAHCGGAPRRQVGDPPPEAVLVPPRPSLAQLRRAAQKAFRRVYCMLEAFVVRGPEATLP